MVFFLLKQALLQAASAHNSVPLCACFIVPRKLHSRVPAMSSLKNAVGTHAIHRIVSCHRRSDAMALYYLKISCSFLSFPAEKTCARVEQCASQRIPF